MVGCLVRRESMPTLLCLFEDEDGDEPGSFELEAYYRPRRMTV